MKTHSYNILLAEDDPAISLIVSTILRRMGHSVEVVHNGKEAILEFTLRPAHYHILITDHDMPMVSGLEVVQHLRKNEFAGKIIVMSGSLTEELLHSYRSRRVNKILQKPFTLQTLSNSLSELFDRWHGNPGEEDSGI